MPNPHLLFCPYLPLAPLDEPIEFADWELGLLQSFEDRWADPKFKSQATTLVDKFTMPWGGRRPTENCAILCKKGAQIDGLSPSREELRALELSIAFGFLDSNPREKADEAGWAMVTTDNVELHLWSIHLEQARITLNRGYLVKTTISELTTGNSQLEIAPPLDLHMPSLPPTPDPLVLTGIYETTLASLRSPNAETKAHRIRVAVDWLARAWRNTASVHYPERLVFLKTAFEAITGTSNAHQSAKELRKIFESLPDATEYDFDCLLWSPTEKPIHNHTWKNKRGQTRCNLITDLEAWFLAFSEARNTIIHEGTIPDLTYPNSTSYPIASRDVYYGQFFSTAERLLRSVIKVLLSKLGYKHAWRTKPWRDILDILDETN